MTPELREYEHRLVMNVRRGSDEHWGLLLQLYLDRIRNLAARWRMDDQAVYDVIMDKLPVIIETYREGKASFWGYMRQVVDRALIDVTRRRENSGKVHLSTIRESDEHGYGGRLSVTLQIEDVEFAFAWLAPHRELCASLMDEVAPEAVQLTFRDFLIVRRSQGLITRAEIDNVLGEFGINGEKGLAIWQPSLFGDQGQAAMLVDDYQLVGERILAATAEGVPYWDLADHLHEPGALIKRYKRHWREVAEIVARDDEQIIYPRSA